MKILKNCRATVIGPMENGSSRHKQVREKLKKFLQENLGVTLFCHYSKPFINSEDETDNFGRLLKEWRINGQYDKIRKYKKIRNEDLRIIDLSDFIIAHIDKNVFTVGTFEELFHANKMKKPIFTIIEGGLKNCPFWIFWTLPKKYLFNNEDEVIYRLDKINKGEYPLDNKRFHILK